jgi:hypothetical protein
MDKTKLIEFLVKAKKKGYAAGEIPEKDSAGSYTSTFEDGELRLNDNWFGGEPFGGREVVFWNGKPYWMMVYYGSDLQLAEKTIEVLQKALSALPDDFPARGPKELVEGEYRYENKRKGNIENFSGEETIFFQDKKVYSAMYAGGLVDQRKD